MKNSSVKAILFTLTVVALAACNPLNKMSKNSDVVKFEATPDPLEMHGDSVEVTVKGTYPTKYFHKKAKVTITPVFKANGEVVKEFKSMDFQGEKAEGEGKVIPFEQGGSFDYTVKLPYSEKMKFGALYAKASGSFKTKEKELAEVKIADGTIVTPLLVQSDDRPIIGKDNFQRTTSEKLTAQINYLINSPVVRSSELRDDDMEQLKADIQERTAEETFTDEASGEEIVIGSYNFKSMSIDGYASPDGEISLNDNLAVDRAESASKAIMRILDRNDIEVGEGFKNLQGKGEDWMGFKREMEASDIEDKDLILRVLQMYDDKKKREEEIKNLAATYVEVADRILPKLRRSEISIMVEKMGKSDDQITDFAANHPEMLNVEEMLYAATLTNDLNNKLSIYKKAAEMFPEDWRTHNNVGYVYLLQNKLNDAKDQFNKAASVDSGQPVIMNNLGVIARLEGDLEKAKDYYSKASGAGSDVNYNKGIINIIEGSYDDATSNFGDAKTFNAALAEVLDGSPDDALNKLQASDDNDSAMGYYLKAIIGARKDNAEMVTNNLNSAFGKDAALKDNAKEDAEFIGYDVANL